jgi:hypothetical protein
MTEFFDRLKANPDPAQFRKLMEFPNYDESQTLEWNLRRMLIEMPLGIMAYHQAVSLKDSLLKGNSKSEYNVTSNARPLADNHMLVGTAAWVLPDRAVVFEHKRECSLRTSCYWPDRSSFHYRGFGLEFNVDSVGITLHMPEDSVKNLSITGNSITIR